MDIKPVIPGVVDTSMLENEKKQEKDTRQVNNDINKDSFLNLFITQLKNQDPLNPTEDKDFLAQMASFSSLEQMQNMNKGFEDFTKKYEASQGKVDQNFVDFIEKYDKNQQQLLKKIEQLEQTIEELKNKK